jgi:hypothetical protein
VEVLKHSGRFLINEIPNCTSETIKDRSFCAAKISFLLLFFKQSSFYLYFLRCSLETFHLKKQRQDGPNLIFLLLRTRQQCKLIRENNSIAMYKFLKPCSLVGLSTHELLSLMQIFCQCMHLAARAGVDPKLLLNPVVDELCQWN